MFNDIAHCFLTLLLDILLHSLVMIFGLCLLKHKAITSFALKKWKILNTPINKIIIFWSASFVLFTVNISCLVYEITIIHQYINSTLSIKKIDGGVFPNFFDSFPYYSFLPITYGFVPLAFYFPPFPFMLIEVFVILCCLRKSIRISSHICCISRLWFIRLVYSLAVFNMFWFAHHIANSFIVSIYFIAMAPAPSLTVIALLISFIVLSIAAISSIAFTCYSAKYNPYKKICQTFLLLLILFCLISFIFVFTLLFLIFTLHGLYKPQSFQSSLAGRL